MSFRNVMMVSIVLVMGAPAWSAEKNATGKPSRGLASVYQSVIRDSQKQLTPSTDQHSVYLRTSVSQSSTRASQLAPQHQHTTSRHAAMPWAAEAIGSGAVFSVK